MVMLLSDVSPPLTVATEDYSTWFPTHEYYISLFTRNMADQASV